MPTAEAPSATGSENNPQRLLVDVPAGSAPGTPRRGDAA
jgi:hypothetical protein